MTTRNPLAELSLGKIILRPGPTTLPRIELHTRRFLSDAAIRYMDGISKSVSGPRLAVTKIYGTNPTDGTYVALVVNVKPTDPRAERKITQAARRFLERLDVMAAAKQVRSPREFAAMFLAEPRAVDLRLVMAVNAVDGFGDETPSRASVLDLPPADPRHLAPIGMDVLRHNMSPDDVEPDVI